MKLNIPSSEIIIPDQKTLPIALNRTTHLGVAAHSDDLEIMAIDGILKCFQKDDSWFCGVVVTDGGGSPRDDLYAGFTDEEMRRVRKQEQKKAAQIGEYGSLILLDYPSSRVKNKDDGSLAEDLLAIIRKCRPQTVYTHNLADKHDTHVGVALRVIEAIRALPEAEHPHRLYGCEVWRDLDWLNDSDKVIFDVSARENLQSALLGVFDSQICGGKRYDLAVLGRRRAHATFFESHSTDSSRGMVIAMDLTPLVRDPSIKEVDFLSGLVQTFFRETEHRIKKLLK